MKEEYIDVNRLKENLITEIYSYSKGDIRKRLFARGLSLAYDIVNRQPTVEPKHGYWVNKGFEPLRCSECGIVVDAYNGIPWACKSFRFCPHCGADMRGEEDGKVN